MINSDSSCEHLRSIRSSACTFEIGRGRLGSNASAHSDPELVMHAFGNTVNTGSSSVKRGRSFGVHGSMLLTHYPVGAESRTVLAPVWTEEPSQMADIGEEYSTRGRQNPVQISKPARRSPTYNALRASALSQPVTTTLEASKSGSCLQILTETEIKAGENKVGRGASHQQSNKGLRAHRLKSSKIPLDSAYNAPSSRYPLQWRAGTDPAPISPVSSRVDGGIPQRPHPLRMSSTHGTSEVESYGIFESSLQASLYTGSRKRPALFMLAIAVAYGGLQDPEHDFELMKTWLKNHESGTIRFLGISGSEATREKIEEAIGTLYREALLSPGSKLLILLTGEGDSTNRMYLMGGRFITDSDMRIWLWKLRTESKPANVPATIVLDYCRTNKHIPLGAMQDGIEFIWSCSIGQKAAALKFKTEDLPRSCFLLALMMAAYDLVHMKDDLKTAINHEMTRLSRFLELVARQRKDSFCEEPQVPDWQQAGRARPIHDLATMLSRMNVVPKVYRVFMSNKWFRDANNLPVNWAKIKRTPSSEIKVRYKRGTCKPVVYARPTDRILKRNLRGS
ncbi:unnamed protein product [Rhizoctonia solani]|uniref:Uncharacterized protein n=1 Tax=Rhizoctonia solani TaxID=456999 RepID=A0A8H3A846_9AGAM|nr:unnamed protein product [Rhizoctonia solani]